MKRSESRTGSTLRTESTCKSAGFQSKIEPN